MAQIKHAPHLLQYSTWWSGTGFWWTKVLMAYSLCATLVDFCTSPYIKGNFSSLWSSQFLALDLILFPYPFPPLHSYLVSISTASDSIACFLPWISFQLSSWLWSPFFIGSDSGLPATLHHSCSLSQTTWLYIISPTLPRSKCIPVPFALQAVF